MWRIEKWRSVARAKVSVAGVGSEQSSFAIWHLWCGLARKCKGKLGMVV